MVVLVDCGEVEKAMRGEKGGIDVLAIGEVFAGSGSRRALMSWVLDRRG